MCKVVHVDDGYDVYIGRSKGYGVSEFGNPFSHLKDRVTNARFLVGSRKESIEQFEIMLNDFYDRGIIPKEKILELQGQRLGCHCKTKSQPNRSCHGDALKRLVDRVTFQERFNQKWGIS